MKNSMLAGCVFLFALWPAWAWPQTVMPMQRQADVFVIPCKVNGLSLKFILDTGSSAVSISLTEALFMLKNDYLSESDLLGASYSQLANGEIVEGTRLVLQEIQIGSRVLRDVEASITHNPNAPLLLGQSALSKLGGFYLDYSANTLVLIEGNATVPDVQPMRSAAPIPPSASMLPPLTMIRILGGTFRMGSNEGDSDEKPIHTVTVSHFYLAETEVTFAQYDYFCERTGHRKPDDAGWGRDDRPVINVSWEDTQAYCAWLSEQTGETWRLPTEAEWEYAAGGGALGRTKWAGTSTESGLGSDAVYLRNSGSRSQPVKSKRPNVLGLYDMSGNVWEWCSDWYDTYSSVAQTDPKGPSQGLFRVLCGGSWGSNPVSCRVAYRNHYGPGFSGHSLGFRLARTF